MPSTSLAVRGILFHKELLVFDKSSIVQSVQWENCCCPLALLGTHSGINRIPLLTPLSALEISHSLIKRHSASLHVIYYPSCTQMSAYGPLHFLIWHQHTDQIDWTVCLFTGSSLLNVILSHI